MCYHPSGMLVSGVSAGPSSITGGGGGSSSSPRQRALRNRSRIRTIAGVDFSRCRRTHSPSGLSSCNKSG